MKLSSEEIYCPTNEESVLSGMEKCNDGSFHEYILGSKLYKFTLSGTKLTIKNNCDSNAPDVVINKDTDNFCVSFRLIS